jgi:hypothetical protein
MKGFNSSETFCQQMGTLVQNGLLHHIILFETMQAFGPWSEAWKVQVQQLVTGAVSEAPQMAYLRTFLPFRH